MNQTVTFQNPMSRKKQDVRATISLWKRHGLRRLYINIDYNKRETGLNSDTVIYDIDNKKWQGKARMGKLALEAAGINVEEL